MGDFLSIAHQDSKHCMQMRGFPIQTWGNFKVLLGVSQKNLMPNLVFRPILHAWNIMSPRTRTHTFGPLAPPPLVKVCSLPILLCLTLSIMCWLKVLNFESGIAWHGSCCDRSPVLVEAPPPPPPAHMAAPHWIWLLRPYITTISVIKLTARRVWHLWCSLLILVQHYTKVTASNCSTTCAWSNLHAPKRLVVYVWNATPCLVEQQEQDAARLAIWSVVTFMCFCINWECTSDLSRKKWSGNQLCWMHTV